MISKEQLSATVFCPICGQELKPMLVSELPKKATWRITDVFKVFAAWVVGQFVVAVLPYVGLSVTRPWVIAYLFLVMAVSYLSLLTLTVYYIRKRGGMLNEIGISLARPKHVVVGVLFGLILMVVSSVVSILLLPFGIIPQQEGFEEIMKLPNAFPTMLLWVGILGPIVEEIYFRGYSYNVFKSRLGKGTAIVASSLLFAFAHLDPLGIIHFTVMGILLAYAYERTGSLPLVALAHIVNNTIATVLWLF